MTRRVALAVFVGVLWLLWWVVIPIGCAVAYGYVHDARILQETPRQYVWMAAGALVWLAGTLVWLAVFPFSPPKAPAFSYLALGLVVVLAGAGIGLTLFNLVNTAGDSPPEQDVAVQVVEQEQFRIRFRVSEGPQAGLEFTCSKSKWGPIGVGRPRLILHRGPRGLWWGKLH